MLWHFCLEKYVNPWFSLRLKSPTPGPLVMSSHSYVFGRHSACEKLEFKFLGVGVPSPPQRRWLLPILSHPAATHLHLSGGMWKPPKTLVEEGLLTSAYVTCCYRGRGPVSSKAEIPLWTGRGVWRGCGWKKSKCLSESLVLWANWETPVREKRERQKEEDTSRQVLCGGVGGGGYLNTFKIPPGKSQKSLGEKTLLDAGSTFSCTHCYLICHETSHINKKAITLKV